MSIFKAFTKSAAAIAIAAAATSASAANGSFYKCIKTDFVQFDGTVVDAAVATPELSTLVSLVSSAGLVDTLANAENITVFAPTNNAFSKVDSGVLSAIGSNPDVLGTVLAYHVVPGRQDPRRWSTPEARETLTGAPVYMYHDGNRAKVNSSNVNCTGIRTTNGTVWLVNSVLLPQF